MKIIPFRLSGYIFMLHDYTVYVHDCMATLSEPRGRAALLRGGISWHLAKEYLSLDAALEGPSQAVMVHRIGQSFRDSDSGCKYWDDDHTKDEHDSLCRLYKCYTGMSLLFPLSHLGLISH